jgi:hypothetical protein
MTPNQMDMIIALHRCVFLPGSFEKRFVKSLFNRLALRNDNKPLTDRQGNYLARLFHKYRKQIGSHDHNLYCELCQKSIDALAKILPRV